MTDWDPRIVIATKRDGKTVAAEDMERFVRAVGAGEVGDGQAAAFLMAAFLQGLDVAETLAMTNAMVASGDTIAFSGLNVPSVDKHSTGGVADGITLIFAPMAAAMGLAVAKLSGRGLAHTGGTLDKLESIPGLRTDLTPQEVERQVAGVGCAIAAQSPSLVPADGALYALRDATATVPSIPLIAASIMSKKLAVSTDLVLLDVKVGSGAFMKTPDDARALAEACVALATGAGRRCGAAITDMSQPLGDTIGNALDVAEAVRVLRGEERGRLRDLAVWFAGRAAEGLLGLEPEEALARAAAVLEDGSALERFAAMVAAQGGDPKVVDAPESILPRAPVLRPIPAEADGWLVGTEAESIGLASCLLGAGRLHKGDPIDPAVGIVVHAKIGDRMVRGEPIGVVHARSDDDAEGAIRRTLAALTVSTSEVAAPELVHDWLAPGG